MGDPCQRCGEGRRGGPAHLEKLGLPFFWLFLDVDARPGSFPATDALIGDGLDWEEVAPWPPCWRARPICWVS
jgi:hypothetical protein